MTGRTRHLLRKFFGATSGDAGKEGLVPAPAAGDQAKFLRGDCTWASGGTALKWAVLQDQKSQNTAGGTFTSGADRTRDLNTEVSDPDNIVTLSSNQFTLGAGSYAIWWDAPAYKVSGHQSMLYDVTGAAVLARGGTAELEPANLVATNISSGFAVIAPASSNVYEIRHQCLATKTSLGFGDTANVGTEVYTQVIICKYA